jgi:hypothetical protein
MKTATPTAAELLKTAELVANEAANTAAVLPYWPIWAAAQFASTDQCKQVLNFVHVWRDADAFQIEATDGHRAFRYRLPAWTAEGLPTLWRIPDAGLLLLAAPLKKAQPQARLLTLTNDLRALFHGGKGSGLDELASVNLAGFFGVTSADDKHLPTFPLINQLWPAGFSNAPGNPWTFNARYLKEWFAVVDKLSPNGLTRTQSNSPITPFVLDCTYEHGLGQHFTDARLELLLMPVQVRQ